MMKQYFFMIAFFAINTLTAAAQETALKNQPSTGDLYEGLTRKITYDRMIPPYGIEVGFNKTVHVIFPASVRYVDLGSANLIAGKADGAENVIRVKAAVQGFERETNFSVITEDGNFYSFNVKYADEPEKLNVEMKDFIHDGEEVNRPNNSLDIYMKELGNESPKVVSLIMKSIYRGDKLEIKHIGSKRFGVQLLLKGIYTYNDFLYFHIQTKNTAQVPFDIDFIRIKIVDKKVAKRTAIQEQVIYPVRAYRYNIRIPGKKTERTVFALPRFTIPDGKQLVVELFEKNGGRHQRFVVENEDITRARIIDDLKVK
jgi:conjugative transposon TraN protein